MATLAARGARILALEPISRTLVPWWEDWAGARDRSRRDAPTNGVSPIALPATLAALDRDAGFKRDGLTARSVAYQLDVPVGPPAMPRPAAP